MRGRTWLGAPVYTFYPGVDPWRRGTYAAEASAAREMNAMRLKLDAAEASAAALTAALVECRIAAADEHLHRMRAEQTETPTALLDCSFASRRRASGLMPG